jgi:2'-5' RNA ligase
MPYGISLKCCNATAIEILELWDEASIFEPSGSMRELNYPPHLTLAVFPHYPGDISAALDEVFSSQEKLSIAFETVEHFDNDLMVLWAKPRFDQGLSNLHADLHRHFDPMICHEHYRAGSWVPHCSLATRVHEAAKPAAIDWAKSKILDFSVEFDVADFVQFPPVLVKQELQLG